MVFFLYWNSQGLRQYKKKGVAVLNDLVLSSYVRWAVGYRLLRTEGHKAHGTRLKVEISRLEARSLQKKRESRHYWAFCFLDSGHPLAAYSGMTNRGWPSTGSGQGKPPPHETGLGKKSMSVKEINLHWMWVAACVWFLAQKVRWLSWATVEFRWRMPEIRRMISCFKTIFSAFFPAFSPGFSWGGRYLCILG